MEQVKPPCPSGRYWRVEAGDTLYAIAQAMGTSVDELQLLNPGVDPSSLQIGEFLCLPAELPPCLSEVFWVVSPGDTLYQISRATGVTLEELFIANPGIDAENLRVGQKICLP